MTKQIGLSLILLTSAAYEQTLPAPASVFSIRVGFGCVGIAGLIAYKENRTLLNPEAHPQTRVQDLRMLLRRLN